MALWDLFGFQIQHPMYEQPASTIANRKTSPVEVIKALLSDIRKKATLLFRESYSRLFA
jgi:DNA-directed RNA polymerase subunit L